MEPRVGDWFYFSYWPEANPMRLVDVRVFKSHIYYIFYGIGREYSGMGDVHFGEKVKNGRLEPYQPTEQEKAFWMLRNLDHNE